MHLLCLQDVQLLQDIAAQGKGNSGKGAATELEVGICYIVTFYMCHFSVCEIACGRSA